MIRRDRIALLLFVALVAAGGFYLRHLLLRAANEPGPSATIQQFDVAPGSSLRSVLVALQKQELIGDARMLEWYLRCCHRKNTASAATVKAGRYRIVPGQPPIEIVRQLIEGRVLLEKVMIPEGWTFAQMRSHLAKQPNLRQTVADLGDAALMEALGAPGLHPEGRFAPDTYSYASGVTTDMQLFSMAFQAQQRNLAEAWEARKPDLPLATPDEALTLASIVEKETGLASERARVAGVFVNRLRREMRLQSDPTVIYGLGDAYDGNIRKRDLSADTPYNTYTRAGLPPTPIALPGRQAIIASLNPEKTDALFFVATGDGSGGHCFSTTVTQHNFCVQQYLARLRAPSILGLTPESPAAPPAAEAPAAADAPPR